MTVTLDAIVTDAGRLALLSDGLKDGALAPLASFKVGEGGWVNTLAGKTRRDPTDPGPAANRGPTLTTLDVLANPADYPADSQATFSKALVPGDVVISGNTTLTVTCALTALEFNDDGFGNNPEIYEVGVFDSGGVMILYGTCPVVVKTPAGPKTFVMTLNAERS
jgi:hypothetical protein